MLLASQTQAVNHVTTGSMSVEFDTLESAFAKAYGEPSVDLGGVIPYSPLVTGPDILAFDTALNVGTATGGSAVPVPGYGVGGFAVYGRGGMPAGLYSLDGYFSGRQSVGTDFTLEARILAAIPGATLTVPAPDQGLVEGIALFETLTTDGPVILFGICHPTAGITELSIHQRTTTAGVLVRKAGVVLSSYAGVMVRVVRTGALFVFTYSIDGGVTWIAIDPAVGATAASYACGLFVNNGSLTLADSLNRVLFDKVVLRKGKIGYFTIIGTNLSLMRSQSPHQLALDGKTDPEAENKVKGWLAAIRLRLIDAKVALLAQPNPVNETANGTTTEQV